MGQAPDPHPLVVLLKLLGSANELQRLLTVGAKLVEALIAKSQSQCEESLALARGAEEPDRKQFEIGRLVGEPATARPDEPAPRPADRRHDLGPATEWPFGKGWLSTLDRLLCRALAASEQTCLVPSADLAERPTADRGIL